MVGRLVGRKTKRPEGRMFIDYLAERVGFEPTVPCGTPDFESGTFDHSAISPLTQHYSLLASPEN